MTDLTLTGSVDRSAAVEATALVIELLGRPEVAARWDDESACAGMSVGALAWHLVNQPQRLVEVLGAEPVDAEVTTLDQHYVRSAWVVEDLDGPANVGVRTRGEDQARAGADAAVSAARQALDAVGPALAAAAATVALPWAGWALSTDDFLVTRLMEMVVHADDLAASVGVETPDFPPVVLEPVLTLLTGLALRRHGQDALVRTLTRPQRAPGSISAF
ncbi:maleylpyruvate isomerase N-terminal domain-containing protein [Cellulomonas sp. HZM]|uniref:maleylpyruvate isomerase N-terminal domain-containing protein n=1 Tax=Cellulomonas sp. HZM TaxID=1454010 RepID=UPI00054CDB9D|nr:maleylpyruvate isomerase N-terminal domain-containing protein [Cellulomonas sp. HZM]